MKRQLLSAAAALALALAGRGAHGQACCAGGSAYAPGRLQAGEEAALALGARAVGLFGSFGETATFRRPPADAGDQSFEQSLVGTLRVRARGQVGARLPWLETRHRLMGQTHAGAGLGDATLAARWDFLGAAESPRWPGIGALLGVTVPTGRAVEDVQARSADETGTGAWQASAGISVERLLGAAFFGLSAQASWSFARTVADVRSRLGPAASLLMAGGRSFSSGAALLATFAASASTDASINGAEVPRSGKRLLTAGLAGGLPLDDRWRVQGTLFCDLPTGGRNTATGAGLTLLLLRAWM